MIDDSSDICCYCLFDSNLFCYLASNTVTKLVKAEQRNVKLISTAIITIFYSASASVSYTHLTLPTKRIV